MPYIVLTRDRPGTECGAVVAPTGYQRKKDGSGIEYDGTPSPEMGHVRIAYRFDTRLEAEEVLTKLVGARIVDLTPAKRED